MPAKKIDAQAGARRPLPASPANQVSPYEMLKQAILSGELAPGQTLVETPLAAWAGVSRTPVREALQRLEQDGLVERNAYGLAVRARSPEEILDLYDTRCVLEARAGRVAAERRTDHDVRLLHWQLNRCETVESGDVGGMVESNQQFHRTVWRASHNESLIDLLERLNLHLARYPGTTLSFPGRWEAAIAEHAALVSAIERRDADAAHDVAMAHFTEARVIRLALFAAEEPSL
jgi:DNA-binding GntR family transcriptional regulator